MTIKRKIEANGAITDTIKLTDEENHAIDNAHAIVAARYKELGLEQEAWEKEHLEYALLGILRYEGIAAMLHWAKTAIISSKASGIASRGYS